MAHRPAPTRPVPFSEFILKVHSRCNLACDYCYMYELADRRARTDPPLMSPEVFDHTCRRLAEHVHTHGLAAARIVLHGGEPLLAGAPALARMAERLRAAVSPASARISVQTNGTLLDERALAVLAEAGVLVGVSLDGDRRSNDRHRRYASGRGSFDAVERALRLLAGRPEAYAGILCVVDLDADPRGTYQALLAHRPPMVDFLLPHANWETPPRRVGPAEGGYGRWLADAFDAWYDAPVRLTRVRLFEELLNLLLGGQSRTESVGLSPVAAVVVNTDGGYEQVDTLRSSYPGAVDTALTVFDDTFDDVLRHPAVAIRQAGVAALAAECRRCPVHQVCGGGNYPHRYRAGSFTNPSVYCADLRLLIAHVSSRLRADLAGLRGG
ncbi:FxsB family cyclophane-forming radical SAM/SPASM peptide maturase [Micromonospora endophytica]|uniref:Radical SAM protein n=1 Tax=Micromonospora endophytica TaxID=515350 RepID=A0A2W2CYC1_9ACTN|nr:FxsB family cyclophane-forming radical SAM/SPASM peptide maturase [Micromonospora endophytica]PZF93419.1 radical SAM protein [Micromonospora endophytica]RIW50937.1 FxsB family radical SAM/SPASM domain protein [Micromonospora endophytica]